MVHRCKNDRYFMKGTDIFLHYFLLFLFCIISLCLVRFFFMPFTFRYL